MADDSDVVIRITGDSQGAVNSAQQVQDALARMAGAAGETGDAFATLNSVWMASGQAAADYQARLVGASEATANFRDMQNASLSALQDATDSMVRQRQELSYLSDATNVLGSEQADVRMAWLQSADGADEYSARLGYLREQLALVREQQQMLADDMGGGVGGFGAGGSSGGGFGGILSSLADIPILGNATSMMTGMMGMQLFNAAYQGVTDFFTQGLFGLNKQTEQNVYSWRYTYGMGMDPSQAMNNAQNISNWSQQFSYSIPFTRQSLMTAISGAAPLGLDLQGLQHYFPMFADLAATHINPFTGQPVDLGTVVQAIRGEEMGYSRMLKYDLNINTQDLTKYGLVGQGSGAGFKITDMTTLLPALEKYSEANGWTQYNAQGQDQGAAFNTAHSTFWGEWSSFLDRVQNLELRGGSSLFGGMKDSLEGISNWMDNHQGQLNDLATLVGNDIAGGFKSASSAVEGFGAGLHASGIDTTVLSDLKNIEAWFGDPKHQQEIKDVSAAVGNGLGGLGKGISASYNDFTDVWNSFIGSGIPSYVAPVLGEFYSRYFAGFGDLQGSNTALLTNLLHGDFGASMIDLKDSLQNLSSIMSFGLIPAINDNTNALGGPRDSMKNGGDPNKPSLAIGAIVGPDNQLSAAIDRILYIQANPKDPNDNQYQSQIISLLQLYMQEEPTNDPAKQKIEQQIMADLQTLALNPSNTLSSAAALADIQKLLDMLSGKTPIAPTTGGQGTQGGQPTGTTGQVAKNPQSGSVSVNDYTGTMVAGGLNDGITRWVQDITDITNQSPDKNPMIVKKYFEDMLKQQQHFVTAQNVGSDFGGALGNAGGMAWNPQEMMNNWDPVWRAGLFARDLAQVLNTAATHVSASGQPQAAASGATDPTAQAKLLVQTLHDGLGTSNGHQMGSDFVGNLGTGMRTQIPSIATNAHDVGRTIGQSVLKGVAEALGVTNYGAGGTATLEGMVQQAIADAWNQADQNIWQDMHTPGALHGVYGTYGQR